VLFHTSVNDPWGQVATAWRRQGESEGRFNLAHSAGFHCAACASARTKNVWVDCSAHLAHCQLARDNKSRPVQRSLTASAYGLHATAQSLEAVYEILGDKYMWGSDNPFMSWYDDRLRRLFTSTI
jgi:hypothetical protein